MATDQIIMDGNRWTDQPEIPDGWVVKELIHLSIGKGESMQIQRRELEGALQYVLTVGNLFGSSSIKGASLTSILEDANAQIYEHRYGNEDDEDDEDDGGDVDWGF